MEQSIDYLELCVALNSLKINTPGNDKINYKMIQQTAKKNDLYLRPLK